MNQRDTLHEGLVWLPDGHVSEWVLSALVDDEAELLPDEATSHVDTCEHCTDRLATMASMVFALDEELAHLVEHQAKREVPFPLALFTGAFLFMVGFAIFSWSAQGKSIQDLPHELLTMSRGFRLIGPFAAQQLGGKLVVLSSLAAVVTAIGGVVLAKRHPFNRTPESPS